MFAKNKNCVPHAKLLFALYLFTLCDVWDVVSVLFGAFYQLDYCIEINSWFFIFNIWLWRSLILLLICILLFIVLYSVDSLIITDIHTTNQTCSRLSIHFHNNFMLILMETMFLLTGLIKWTWLSIECWMLKLCLWWQRGQNRVLPLWYIKSNSVVGAQIVDAWLFFFSLWILAEQFWISESKQFDLPSYKNWMILSIFKLFFNI